MMVYGMVQNEQDAWDLAQEGFLKAWKSIHRFKGESSFYTWLYRIMTNVTIDSLRRKGIHGEAEFDDRIAPANVEPGSRTTPSAVPLPHIKLEQHEIRQRIDEAIGKLSPEHRAVIVMKEIEDLQYSEIAEILGCSLGTVMSRLFYARKNYRSCCKTCMKTFEEKFTAWLDGALSGEELRSFENEHPSILHEKADFLKLKSLIERKSASTGT